MEGYLDTKEAADLTGYSLNYIRKLVRTNKVKGLKVSGVWLIDKDSLLGYRKRATSKSHRELVKEADKTERRSKSVITPHDLLLNTWFVMYLHGDRPGGLPNDFLSRGSSALLLFDTVFCDKDALESEERFTGNWLSSDLFLALKEEGILEPISMREYLPQEFLDHLRDTGMTQAALKTMEAELSVIKKGERKPQELQLPPFLTWLNHYMFMGLEIPTSLLYEWQEYHFKVPPPAQLPLQKPTLELPDVEEARRQQQIVSVLKALLPEFFLLPPLLPESEAFLALQRNITQEKPALYRWIYGDTEMPRDRYHELRLGPDFRSFDAKVDESRKALAWRNFEILMKARQATKDVRAGMQTIISDVVDERRTITDVEAEVRIHQEELLSHLPSQRSITVDITLAGIGFAVTIAEILGTLSGLVPGVSPIGLGLAAYGVWKARTERQQYHALRQRYPLAWFLRDFREIQRTELSKLIPRRRRR